jgi:hypothetical protein
MRIFLVIVSILINCSLIFAQTNGSSARSLSMGNSSVSVSRGIDAINSNPANLAFFNRKNWEISVIPRVVFDISNSSFTFGTYKNYFTADKNGNPRYLDNIQKMDLLSLIEQNEPNKIYTSTTIDIFNIAVNYKQIYGGFGLSVRDRIFSNIDISRDAFDLLLFGNELNRKYDFSSTSGTGYWFREYTVGYGFEFYKSGKAKAAFGINLKYLQGNAFYNIDCQNSEFTTTDNSLNGTIKINSTFSYIDFFENSKYSVFNTAGHGQAFDIGFGFTDEIISFGLTLKDFGYLKWHKNVFEININETSIIKDITDENEHEPYKDIFNKNKSEIDAKQVNLPASIQSGISYKLLGRTSVVKSNMTLILNAEYSLTLKNNNLLNKNLSLFNMGLEFKPFYWLPLRAGFVFGDISPRLSFGTGISTPNFDFDIGFGNIGNLYLSKSSKSAAVAISTKFLF